MPPVSRTYNTNERTPSRPVNRRRPPVRTTQRARPEEKSTPLLLRILSWLGILLLFFVLGYLGTSWVVNILDRKLFLKPDDRVENQEDLSHLQESKRSQVANNPASNAPQISLNLYHVMNDSIAQTTRNFSKKVTEDNISDAVNAIISLSNLQNSNKIKLLHVFRYADTAFLDMSGQFASSLASAGKRKSLLLLTGIVRTMTQNFPPITQIRFLIDSKAPAPKAAGEVDLGVAWKMPK